MKEYEVVISGMSGSFPGHMDVERLREQLYDRNDAGIVTLDSKGFVKNGEHDEAEFIGAADDSFDYTHFGLRTLSLYGGDGYLISILGKVYEAIVDAGINPMNLKGEKVSVVSSIGVNSEVDLSDTATNRFAIIIANKSMTANRVSYFFDLTGQSFMVHGLGEGGLNALDLGARLVAKGHATAAIVSTSTIITSPEGLRHGSKDCIPLLSNDGKTRSFSRDASGFSRSESTVAFYLQRKEDALRSYGKIEKSLVSALARPKTKNSELGGFNIFLKEFYNDTNFDPEEIAYIEADGIGIPELDREELEGILNNICSHRKSSLPVSCCKTKLGNTFSTSGLVSLVHCILASQEGHVPPTLHYNPHEAPSHPANDPHVKIVTEKTPVKGRLYGVSSYSFGGVYGHAVISQNEKSRQPSDILGPQDPPALIVISGRNNFHMDEKLKAFSSSTNEKGYVALVHKAFSRTHHMHTVRGFAITNSPVPVIPTLEVNDFSSPLPVWFMFSGMGSQWNGMGTDLLKLPFIADSLHRSHQVLLSKGIDLISVITSTDPNIYDNIMNSFIGIVAIQVALVDLVSALRIKPDGIIGHSVGELACGYADGCLTAEQAILCAYARGKASIESTLIKGMMAAIGKGYADIKDNLPNGIEVACHNSSTSCTISGPAELVEEYVNQLKTQGIFAKLVNVSNIAYHSQYIAPAGEKVLKYTKEVIVSPVERSSKWLCTSTEESRWDEAKMCSAEYYTNNLLKPVLFEEAAKHIHKEALVIEIAPHGLLQPIVKRSHPKCFHVPLTSRTAANNLVHLLEAVGRLHICGIDMDLSSIYPEVSFPVPRETKSLNSLVSWNFDESVDKTNRTSCKSNNFFNESIKFRNEETISVRNNYLFEGKSTIPVPFILDHIKCAYGQKVIPSENGYLEFQNVKVHSLLQTPLKKNVNLSITLFNGGEFYVFGEEEDFKLSGVCYDHDKAIHHYVKESREDLFNLSVIEQGQIYSLLENIGYQIEGPFRNIMKIELSASGFIAKIGTQYDFKYLLNSMILSVIFYHNYCKVVQNSLDSIGSIRVQNVLPSSNTEKEYVDVFYSAATGTVSCPGIVITSIVLKNSSTHLPSQLSKTLKTFLPLQPIGKIPTNKFLMSCIQIVLQEKLGDTKQMIVVEVSKNYFDQELTDILCRIKPKVKFISICEDEMASLFTTENNNNFSYVVVYSGNKLPEQVVELCQRSYDNFAMVITDKSCREVNLNKMECALKCELEYSRGHLLKKKQTSNLNQSSFVSTFNTEWKKQIKTLHLSSRSDCYIVSDYNLYSEVMAECEKCWDFSQTQNLRFVFLGDGCPKFDPKSLFYKNHLEKGFKVNVCLASEWGYLPELPTEICFSENMNHIILDNISSDLFSTECVSLLLDDSSICHHAVEYGGKIDNSRVMGVGTLEGEMLRADPVLHWECPQEWTMEQACTVPLFYSMAYYMIEVIAELDKGSRVLILGGDSPAGEAAIRVAISTGASVFVTCSTQADMDAMKLLFPKLVGSNLYFIRRNQFLAEVEQFTSGQGYQLVLNFLSDKCSLISSLGCMAKRETTQKQQFYIQVSKHPIKNNFIFGQSIFIRSVSLLCCEPGKIADLEYEMKVRLRECMEQGIERGVVKPLKYVLLSRPVTRNQLIKKEKEHDFEKIVVSLNEDSKSSLEVVGRNKSNLLIGQGDIFFHLIFDLIRQANMETHLVFDEINSPSHQLKRLNTILQSFDNRKVHLHSYSLLNSTENCNAFIRNIQKSCWLEKAVVVTEGLPEGVWKGLDELETRCRVCLVGEEPEGWCQAQAQLGRSCVCLVPEPDLLLSSFLPLLGHLSSSQINAQGVYYADAQASKLAVCNRQDDLLPSDLSELEELAYSLEDSIGFTEVPTKSSPYRHVMEYSPVFLIPGFRRSKINKLTPNLYCPAFIATMPKQLPHFDQHAAQLKNCLIENFHQTIYTFVCEGWSVLLTFKVAQLLEQDGKECQIFVIGQSVSQIQNSLRELSVSKLHQKYFNKESKEVRSEIKLTPDSSYLQQCLINMIEVATMISNVDCETIHHIAYVTNIRPFMEKEIFQVPDMQKLCKRQIFVHCVDTKDGFQSDELAGIISDCVFHELPGLAHRQNLYKQQEIRYYGQVIGDIKCINSL